MEIGYFPFWSMARQVAKGWSIGHKKPPIEGVPIHDRTTQIMLLVIHPLTLSSSHPACFEITCHLRIAKFRDQKNN
jgi:hypothetical protein